MPLPWEEYPSGQRVADAPPSTDEEGPWSEYAPSPSPASTGPTDTPSLRQAPEPSLKEKALRAIEPYVPNLLLESFGRIPAPQGEKALRALVDADTLTRETGVFVHPSATYQYQDYLSGKDLKTITPAQAKVLSLTGTAWARVKQAWDIGTKQDTASELGWQYVVTGNDHYLKQVPAMPDEDKTFLPRTLLEESAMKTAMAAPMTRTALAESGMKGALLGMSFGTIALAARHPEAFFPALRAGMLLGNIEGALEATTRKEGGSAVLSMLQAGIDPQVARMLAIPYGLSAGVLEVMQFKLLLNTVPGARRLLQDSLIDTATDRTVKEKLMALGKEYVATTGSEVGIELLQQADQIFHEELAKKVSNRLAGTDIPPATMDQIMDEMKQTARSATLGFAPLVGAPLLLRAGHTVVSPRHLAPDQPVKPLVNAVEEQGAKVQGVVQNEVKQPETVIVTEPVSGRTVEITATATPEQGAVQIQTMQAQPASEHATQAVGNLEPMLSAEMEPTEEVLAQAFDQAVIEPPPIADQPVASPTPLEAALQSPEAQALIQQGQEALQAKGIDLNQTVKQVQQAVTEMQAAQAQPTAEGQTFAQDGEVVRVKLDESLLKSSPYNDQIELVPIRELKRFAEYDRKAREFTPGRIAELKESLSRDGFKDAMILDYNAPTKKALLIEGNHRLVAAEELGYTHAPVRVVRSESSSSETARKGVRVPGVEPDFSGYVPNNQMPSTIGIPGAMLLRQAYTGGKFFQSRAILSNKDIVESVAIHDALTSAQTPEEAYPALRDMSRAFYTPGMTEAEFTEHVRTALGDLLTTPIEQAMTRAYDSARALSERLAEERGSFSLKKAIRETTGQVKDQELNNLNAALKKAEQASKEAYRAGNKAGIEKAEAKVNEIKESIKGTIRRVTGQVKDQELKDLKASFIKTARAARESYLAGKTEEAAKQKAKLAAILDRARSVKAIRAETLTLKKLQQKATGRIAVDYQKKLADLMAGVDLSTPTDATVERLQGLSDFIQREGVPLGLPQTKVNQLTRLSAVPFRDLSPEARSSLLNAAKELVRLGTLKQKLKDNAEARALQKQHDALIEHTVNLDPALSGERPPTKADTYKVGLQHASMDLVHTFRVANRLDGLKDYQGPNARLMIEEMHTEIAAKNETRRRILTMIEGLQRLGIDELSDEQTQRINVILMAEQGARGQAVALMDAYKMDALPTLTPVEREVVALIRKVVAEKTEQIATLYEQRENLPFMRVPHYFPIKYEGEFAIAPGSTINQDRYRTRQTPQGFTKVRQPYVEDIPRSDILAVAEEAVLDQEWYLQMQPVLDRHAALTRTPEYKEAAGQLGWNYWKDQIDLVARKGWAATAHANPALRTIRVNLNQAILGYKLSSTLMQPFAVFDAVAATLARFGPMSAARVANEFTKAWINPVAALKYVEASPALSLRQAGEVAVEEVLDKAYGKKGWAKTLSIHSMSGLRTADVITAAGVHRGLQTVLEQHGLTAVEARAEADFLMNVVSGSSEVTIRPHVLARGEAARTWFTFQTFFMNRWGLIADDIIRQGLTGTTQRKATAFLALLLMMAGGVVEDQTRDLIYTATTGRPGPNQEAWWTKVLLYLPRQVPVIGNLYDKWASADPPILREAGRIGTGTQQFARGEPISGIAKVAEGLLSMILGIPGTAQAFDFLDRLTEDLKKQERRDYQREHPRQPTGAGAF